MADQSLHYSSNSDLWQTPEDFFQMLNAAWGFTLDPACTESSAKCDKFYTPEDDGLAQSWAGETVWVNPPYSRGNASRWIQKCYEESEHATVVVLPAARTDTTYMHEYGFKCDYVCFIKGRLKFDNPDADPDDKKNPAPFPSMLLIYDACMTPEKMRVLSQLGVVMKPEDMMQYGVCV